MSSQRCKSYSERARSRWRFTEKKRLHPRKYISKGPTYIWHIDGHDKLKPFDVSLHGCIDGFSRKLIWLKVGLSNKNPDAIAHYYLDAISELGGVPHIIKADDGTEHALIEPIHIYLRSINEEEGIENAFSITTSPQNQRIEAYWSILQRDRLGWWKRFLKALSGNEMLDTSDPVILDCVRFSFIDLIRHELKN